MLRLFASLRVSPLAPARAPLNVPSAILAAPAAISARIPSLAGSRGLTTNGGGIVVGGVGEGGLAVRNGFACCSWTPDLVGGGAVVRAPWMAVAQDAPLLVAPELECMNRNARKPKAANHGKRQVFRFPSRR